MQKYRETTQKKHVLKSFIDVDCVQLFWMG